MVDGGIMDGPEWGYEIAPHHMNQRSYIFNDLPESVATKCAELGYDYEALVTAKDQLYAKLHNLSPTNAYCNSSDLAACAQGGLFGAIQLLEIGLDFTAWFRFRIGALTSFFENVRNCVDVYASRQVKLGVGPRTPCFAPLCGYDFPRPAHCMDILLPKHYFWHRGFDGLYGTAYRYVETLTMWNPGLCDEDAFAVVKALFGLELPGVRKRNDLDKGFPPEFFETVVKQETRRALASVDDADRIVPWVDAGRRPHDGDPMPAGDLHRLLVASREAGLTRFLYHHHGTLTTAEWSVLTELCGKPWRPDYGGGYKPPDEDVL